MAQGDQPLVPNMKGRGYGQCKSPVQARHEYVTKDFMVETEEERLQIFSGKVVPAYDNILEDLIKQGIASLESIGTQDLERKQGHISGLRKAQEILKQLKPKEE
jgi:hypothetical protein